MKDIVERLRNWTIMPAASPASDIMDEAADEIERLRADWPEQLTAHKVLITEQELEIARLRLRLSAKGDCPEPENETKQDIPPLLSRAGTNGETAGEHAAKCTVASAKLPERERVAAGESTPVAWVAFATDGSESRYVSAIQKRAQSIADEYNWCIAPLFAGLSAEEREAIEWAARAAADPTPVAWYAPQIAATLRALLERMGGEK